MFTLFLCVALGADPVLIHAKVPDQVREYFERADKNMDGLMKLHQDRIKGLEIAIRGEGVPQLKSKLRRELAQVVKSFDELKKSKPLAPMLGAPAVGDIGYFESFTVVAVIDDHTVQVQVQYNSKRGEFIPPMSVLLTGPSVKSLKSRQMVHGTELWRVTDTDVEKIPLDQKRRGNIPDIYKVEPVKKAELDQYRAMYEAEKKQNVAPPADIKDEKPKLDKAPMPDKPKGDASEK